MSKASNNKIILIVVNTNTAHNGMLLRRKSIISNFFFRIIYDFTTKSSKQLWFFLIELPIFINLNGSMCLKIKKNMFTKKKWKMFILYTNGKNILVKIFVLYPYWYIFSLEGSSTFSIRPFCISYPPGNLYLVQF